MNTSPTQERSQLLTPTTFSLVHCTDFADRNERQIQPLLKAGFLVPCDRFCPTAVARDAVRGYTVDPRR